MRRVIGYVLLACATVHCVLSIFFLDMSYLDLGRYAAGTEYLPFQRRLLLIPYVRWAAGNRALGVVALRYGRFVRAFEPMSAAKLGVELLGLAAVLAAGFLSTRLHRRVGVWQWWLIWALLLVILYASFGARYEQNLWYPYDLPHLALFGAATLCLLADAPLAFAALMVVDIFVRETSVFLLLVAAFVFWRDRRWWAVLGGLACVWLGSRLLAQHLYPNNAYQANPIPWYRMLQPWHVPQILSIAGFLPLPVWIGRRWLSARARRALLGATVLIGVTFFFATWNETRAWGEWSMLFAVLAAGELEAVLGHGSGDHHAAGGGIAVKVV